VALADQPGTTFRRDDLPSLYRAASATSKLGQQATTRWTGYRLLFLLAAAVAGAATWHLGGLDVAGLGAALAFFVALLFEVRAAVENPERRWYRGRAAAESVKTLAWKYAVGGSPFEIGDQDADKLLVDRLGEIVHSVGGLEPVPGDAPDQVTPKMRALRAKPLADRRAVYLRDRIADQHGWYAEKTANCRAVAERWSAVIYGVTALGFAGGIAKGVGAIDLDLLGLAAATVAAATAWTQLRQYRTLAAAYSITAHELGLAKEQIAKAEDEPSWAEAVNAAEEAISREHTLWLARRDPAP
jgi:hypothetical protein